MIEKVFVSCLITDDIDSAPDDSEVHFERFEQEHSLAQGLEPRDGRQGGSLLGCLMGCTRELRVGLQTKSVSSWIAIVWIWCSNERNWDAKKLVFCFAQ